MADTYFSACFTFCCTNAEMALLEEVFNAAEDLNCELEPPAPSRELLEAFPPTEGGDPWSGFLAIFDDATFPILGADLTGGNSFEEPTVSTPMISGTVDFQPWPIAASGCRRSICPGTRPGIMAIAKPYIRRSPRPMTGAMSWRRSDRHWSTHRISTRRLPAPDMA